MPSVGTTDTRKGILMAEHAHTNRLIHETSPYLLQHAHNPVDWYPWGPEALSRARNEDKPIFLSIGYSACHWCHVMERESFEDEATASVMNEFFINIKVDREERPDLDQIYMSATQLITQHGGWPMSVWLSPDLKPYYAGTYFPPTSRHGLPAFTSLCRYLGEAWKTRRQEVLDSSEEVAERVREMNQVARRDPSRGGDSLDARMTAAAGRTLARYIDQTHGGFGTAPKFPHSTELRVILRAADALGDDQARQLAELSLDRMIRGGIYDQIGGGFHRYSTDQRWLVPHFEKMLYDNALIPLACIEASQLTTDPTLRETFDTAVRETLGYVLREMTSPEGPFYSTQDADSEGVEGKFFVWSKEEVMQVLGPELGPIACQLYDVSEHGNWEESNILQLLHPLEESARLLRMSVEELQTQRATIRCKLFGQRAKRIHPGRDEKVLTAWNGMMIDTLAVADFGQGGPWLDAARQAAQFILQRMRSPAGLLYRTYKDGRARLNGYLEDYSYLANGLISLYEATFDRAWISSALEIVDVMIDQCWDEAEGGFFFTGKDHEALIARGKDPRDGAIPSGNAMAATALARLAKLTGRADLVTKLERTFDLFSSMMRQSPMEAAQMLIAWDIFQPTTREIAIVGDPAAAEVGEVRQTLRSRFLPNKVIALRRPWETDADISPVDLLLGKTASPGAVTIHVCRQWTCSSPTTSVAEFARSLDS
jgi:uncharacterized protein YyaL (SSP411 family)